MWCGVWRVVCGEACGAVLLCRARVFTLAPRIRMIAGTASMHKLFMHTLHPPERSMKASSFFTASPATLRALGPPPLRSSVAYRLLVATAVSKSRKFGVSQPGIRLGIRGVWQHRVQVVGGTAISGRHEERDSEARLGIKRVLLADLGM